MIDTATKIYFGTNPNAFLKSILLNILSARFYYLPKEGPKLMRMESELRFKQRGLKQSHKINNQQNVNINYQIGMVEYRSFKFDVIYAHYLKKTKQNFFSTILENRRVCFVGGF